MIKAVLFDLGDTLIHERIDDLQTLDQIRLNPKNGAPEVLKELHEHFLLGLITDTESSDEFVVRRALRNLGLEDFFQTVVTSQDVGVTKPDQQIFNEAVRRLDVTAAEAVVVGNDLDRDIAPAIALGMEAVLVSDSAYFDSSRQTTAAVVTTLWDVPGVILAMAGGQPRAGRPSATPRSSDAPHVGPDDPDDLRAQYAAAMGMCVYDGALSWQVTGLYVQFAFLLAAGAVFPSFVGTSDRFVLALAGGLIAVAGFVTAAMFGSMCLRIRTYQDLWVSRAEAIEAEMFGPGVLSAGSQLSRDRQIGSSAGQTVRMSRLSAVKTKTMMNVLFAVFAALFVGLFILNIVRAVRAA